MAENVVNRASFGLLPEPEGRWGSFGVSAIANIVLAALLMLFMMASLHHDSQLKRLQSTELIFPTSEPPKISQPPVPKVKYTPPPQTALLTAPKISLPKEMQKIEPPKVQEVKMNTPFMPAVPPAPPRAVAPPPQPKVGMFASAAPTQVANNKTAPSPKMGGFGDPVGVRPNPNAAGRTQLVALGSFANAPGGAQGAGAARTGAVQGVSFGSGVAHGVPGGTGHGTVASAGFKNGMIGGTPGGTGTGRGSVATGNLGGTGIGGAGTTPTVAPTRPSFTPPEVLSEPKPQYTAEAKQARIQGEVTLQVNFLATGQVQVLRVVNGLGHGLDEQATRVAQQIRFKPAMKDGQAVDHTTLIHVTFQLA